MKTSLPACLFRAAMVSAALTFTTITLASVGPAPTPSSTLGVAADDTNVSVTITNPGDQVWIIQSSSDFVNWNELEELKIHNGNFQRSYSRDPEVPFGFYRAVYDPARQD